MAQLESPPEGSMAGICSDLSLKIEESTVEGKSDPATSGLGLYSRKQIELVKSKITAGGIKAVHGSEALSSEGEMNLTAEFTGIGTGALDVYNGLFISDGALSIKAELTADIGGKVS